MLRAYAATQAWAQQPGGVPAEARAATVAFADFYLDLMGLQRVGPHLAPQVFEPAIAACRAEPALAEHEAAFVQALCARDLDFGDLDAARKLLTRENLERYDQQGSDEAAWCWLLASGLARLEGRTVEAEQLLDAARARYDEKRAGHAQLAVFLASERVAQALYLGRIDQAALAYRRMEAALRKTESWFGEHALRLHKIRIRLATGRTEGVPQIAREGIQAAQERLRGIEGRARRRCNTLLARYELYAGIAARRGGDFTQARSYLEAALAGKDIGGERREPSLGEADVDEAHLNLAMVDAFEGHPEAAQQHLDSVADVFAELRDSRSDAPWVKTPRLVATRALCARLSGSASAAELAQLLTELRRAYLQFLQRWDAAPIEPGGIGFLQLEDRRFVLDQLIELIGVVEGKEAAEQSLEAVLAAQARGSLARSLGLKHGTLADLRAFLGPRGGLLLYLPGTDTSHLFIVDEKRCEHASLARLETLRRLQGAVTRALNPTRPKAELRAAAEDLGAELLPPAAWQALAEWQSVTVVGSSLLGNAPIELLPGKDGRPLGLALPVTHLPSIPIGRYLKRRSEIEARRFGEDRYTAPGLALLAPTYSQATRTALGAPSPVQLPEGSRAGALFDSLWGPERVFRGGAATLDCLRHELRPRALHILTHGVSLPAALRPAAALLGDTPGDRHPGILDCDQAETLWSGAERSAPDLVTLGVCRTARGPSRFGEDGVQHLGGAFLAAGAEVVLLASGDLDRDATEELLESFYRHEAEGLTPAQALTRARRELASVKRFSHPYYWGQIEVLGLGHQPLHRP